MKTFEYETVASGTMDASNTLLNEKGQEGWELVSVNQVGVGLRYYFKREQKNGKPGKYTK